MGDAAIQPGTKLGPIGHTISLMANWPPLVFYALFVHSTFPWPNPTIIGLPGQILPSLASLANFHIPNPGPLPLFLGLGVSFGLLGGSGPPSHNHHSWATPFH
ncbi:hypothetical protein O181_036380 [Austropuccinia psidii MF-1]|uniref:Uncharacterized protein n=1 Tax=Austropuccinia psidii MF-1 TaxID=1389203 RepID=A0A9Q3D6G4_9BASI|nr:hypothetical protein [Austropuccinia psidii MF-1]